MGEMGQTLATLLVYLNDVPKGMCLRPPSPLFPPLKHTALRLAPLAALARF